MKRFALLFFCLVSLDALHAQTKALLNTDWELRIIYNTQANKKTFVDASCRSTLFFQADSTYRGRGCCNAVIPSYSGIDESKVKVSRFLAKENGELIMTKPSHKSIACLNTNTEELLFKSWAASTHYSFKQDTLVIRCANSTDLYYIKVKQN